MRTISSFDGGFFVLLLRCLSKAWAENQGSEAGTREGEAGTRTTRRSAGLIAGWLGVRLAAEPPNPHMSLVTTNRGEDASAWIKDT
jgi:hypothetical protein